MKHCGRVVGLVSHLVWLVGTFVLLKFLLEGEGQAIVVVPQILQADAVLEEDSQLIKLVMHMHVGIGACNFCGQWQTIHS